MKITIIQNITKVLDMDRTLLSSRTNESYLLEPAPGKMIQHIPTGELYHKGICINKKRKFAEYQEIEDPKASQ